MDTQNMSRFGNWISAQGFRVQFLPFRWGRGKPAPTDAGFQKMLKESNGRHADAMRAVTRRLKKKGG